MSVTKYMVFTPGSTAPPGGPWTFGQLRTRRSTGEVPATATVSIVGESAWRSVDEILAELDTQPLWLVRSPGSDQLVGPVSVDLIRRGLAAGKIPSDSLAAEDGSTEWLPVTQVAAAPTEPDTESAASHPARPVAPAPETNASPAVSTSLGMARKGSSPRRAHIVGGLAVLGLAGAVTFVLVPRGSPSSTGRDVPAATSMPAAPASAPADPEAAARLGFKLYDDDDNEAGAVRLWEPACEKGNDLACTGIATAYTFGVGGKSKDEKRALSWLEPACGRGTLRACNLLARFHYFGLGGLSKDIEKGRMLWKQACDGDEPRGCYWLGLTYTAADGPPAWHDEPAARLLYEKGCRLGHKDSCEGVAKLDRAKRTDELKAKVKKKFWDREKDAECLGKAYPPYKWDYEGGTFAENQEVAEADGCKKLHRTVEIQTYCCPAVPNTLGF